MTSRAPAWSIYLSTLNGLDTALAYAAAFDRAGTHCVLALEPRIAPEALALLPEGRGHVVLPHPPVSRVERIYEAARSHASSMVLGDNKQNAGMYAPAAGWKRTAVVAWRRFPVKPSSGTLNRRLQRLFARWAPARFTTDDVLVISTAARPLALCHPRLRVHTVMDSWDHAVRRPAGYSSGSVVAWNEALAEDWQDRQGADRCLLGPATKFEYALGRRWRRPSGPPTALYPLATTSADGRWFEDELRLVAWLVEATRRAGWNLLVKPKPMNAAVDLERVPSADHVRLGTRKTSSGTLDFRLDADYNAARLQELDSCSLVISSVTTFGLDAAVHGAPLLQLDLRGVQELGTLAAAADNAHLRDHLYPVAHRAVLSPRSREQLVDDVARWLRQEPSGESEAASRDLDAWLQGEGRSYDDVVAGLIPAGPGRA